MKTREQALRDLGLVVAEWVEKTRKLTAREAAERAWRLDHPMSIDELTAHIESLGICRRGVDEPT